MQLHLKICKDYEEFIHESVASQYSGDVRAGTGHVGLKNQGATCYLNSLMQALYHTAFLREAVFQIPSEAVPAAEVDSDSDDEAVGTVGVQQTKKKSKTAAVAVEPAAPVPDSVVLALQRVFYRLQFSQGSVGTKVARSKRFIVAVRAPNTHLLSRNSLAASGGMPENLSRSTTFKSWIACYATTLRLK